MHKTTNNKFFWLWRYKIKIQLYNVCILSNVWLKVANYILRSSNVQYPNWGDSDVEYSTFDGRLIECRKSDIRRRALPMSNIRHSMESWSNVQNLTSEEGRFECRIFDIHMRPNESKKSDPENNQKTKSSDRV